MVSLRSAEFPRLAGLADHSPDGNALKDLIETLVRDALAALPDELRPSTAAAVTTTVERTRDPAHGDFACNVALQLARAAKRKPRPRFDDEVIDVGYLESWD